MLLWPARCGAGAQSLADVARKEAERRKALAEQGIAGKVLAPQDLESQGSPGNVTVSSPGQAPNAGRSDRGVPKSAGKPDAYRTRLQSLDRQIRAGEDQLRLLRQRVAAERWAPPRAGRLTGNQKAGSSYEELQYRAEQLAARLEQLRAERRRVYEEGRKAGFLPGELEGRRITP